MRTARLWRLAGAAILGSIAGYRLTSRPRRRDAKGAALESSWPPGADRPRLQLRAGAADRPVAAAAGQRVGDRPALGAVYDSRPAGAGAGRRPSSAIASLNAIQLLRFGPSQGRRNGGGHVVRFSGERPPDGFFELSETQGRPATSLLRGLDDTLAGAHPGTQLWSLVRYGQHERSSRYHKVIGPSRTRYSRRTVNLRYPLFRP